MIPLKRQKRNLRPFLPECFLISLKQTHFSLMKKFTKYGYESSLAPEQIAGKKETLRRAPIGLMIDLF